MAETYRITKVEYNGEKPNPRQPGQTLHKHKVSLLAESSDGDAVHDVYWQSVAQHHEGEEVYGDVEDGEYGPRFRTAQRDGGSSSTGGKGGNFKAPSYERVPDNSDRSARIERQHSQHMALLFFAAIDHEMQPPLPEYLDRILKPIIDWFDADVGGGSTQAIHDAPPVAADVSAGNMSVTPGVQDAMAEAGKREASPAQKGKLTQLFGKAGLSRDAMKAVVLFRCRSEKATKDGASKLIQDLMDGATHDTLLAEIHDAKRAGDPLAVRAAALIPSDTPLEPEPEPVVEPNGEKDIPF